MKTPMYTALNVNMEQFYYAILFLVIMFLVLVKHVTLMIQKIVDHLKKDQITFQKNKTK